MHLHKVCYTRICEYSREMTGQEYGERKANQGDNGEPWTSSKPDEACPYQAMLHPVTLVCDTEAGKSTLAQVIDQAGLTSRPYLNPVPHLTARPHPPPKQSHSQRVAIIKVFEIKKIVRRNWVQETWRRKEVNFWGQFKRLTSLQAPLGDELSLWMIRLTGLEPGQEEDSQPNQANIFR